MGSHFVFTCIVGLASLALAQPPSGVAPPNSATPLPTAKPSKIPEAPMPDSVPVDPKLKDLFQSKIQSEWEAIKNKDRKAYAELLDDEYQGVEVDGKGERTKTQMLNELAEENIFRYTLWGFRVIPIGPDAALVTYESTMQFPPSAQMRLARIYISELWVKRAGEWKELHSQETHVK
jgi:Domain of unknown function (DUF4440)